MTPIPPGEWRRADALFQEAIELPRAERRGFVTSRCAGDVVLLAAVLQLLVADESEDGILDSPVDALARSAGPALNQEETAARGQGEEDFSGASAEPAADPHIGQSFGRYRVLSRLGEGGMGLVYEAEQEEPHRRVALKVMRGASLADDASLRFFRRETQTLARLQHPGIAAIYEAGRTGDGRPFFAMELVRGVPLDAAFDAADRPPGESGRRGVATNAELRARLILFLEICDAIAYAHQRGVIHRDLKPSNILVTTDIETAADMRGKDPSSTPRSARIKVVDFGLAQICDVDVSMIASRTSSRALQGTLPYMSPEQTLGEADQIDFRSDVYSLGVILYRLLTTEPPYVVRADALIEAIHTIREKPPARAGAVNPLLRGDIETIILKTLEKEPDRRYHSVAALADDIRRFLADQPILARTPSTVYQLRKLAVRHRAATLLLVTLAAVLAVSTVTMGILYQGQRRERDRAVLEAAKARRVSDFLSKMLVAVDPEEAQGQDVTVREVLDEAARDVALELKESPEVAASLQTAMGRAYRVLGLYDVAEPQLSAALEARKALYGAGSTEVAASLEEMGHLAYRRGRLAEADSILALTLPMRKRLLGDRHADVASSVYLMAMVAYERGNFTLADSLHRVALDIRSETFGDESPEVLSSTSNLALAVHGLGHQAEAESLYRRAVDVAVKHYGEGHPQHAVGLNNVGLLMHDAGKWDEAEVIFRRALAIRRAAFGNEHPEVAISLNNLARTLRVQNRYDEAVPLYLEAIAICEKRLGERHAYVFTMRGNLANVYDRMGRTDLAIAMFEASLASMRLVIGPDHSTIALTINNLALCLQRSGALERAAVVEGEALSMLHRLFGREHPQVCLILHNMAGIRREQKRFAEAESLETSAYVIRKKVLGSDHLDVAESAETLAGWALDRDEIPEAIRLCEEALSIGTRKLPAGNWRLARATSLLGACQTVAGNYAVAESLLVRSHLVLIASPSASIDLRRRSFERIIRLYDAWGKRSKGVRYRDELSRLPA